MSLETKIKEMQGTFVEIKSKNQILKWTIIEDVDPPMMHGPAERSNLGIQDFDFENMPRDEVFARMFFHLTWIGIDEHLVKFNATIDEHNKSIRVSRQRIKTLSKSELIVGYALFVAAAGFYEKGIHLFDTKAAVDSFLPPTSFRNYMKFHRFKVCKQFIVKVNEDKAREPDGNPWWKFATAVDGLNDVRLKKLQHLFGIYLTSPCRRFGRAQLRPVNYQTSFSFFASWRHFRHSSSVPYVPSLAL
jgi:hypothetical protein